MIYFRWEPILHISGNLWMDFIPSRMKPIETGSQIFYTLLPGVNRVMRSIGLGFKPNYTNPSNTNGTYEFYPHYRFDSTHWADCPG